MRKLLYLVLFILIAQIQSQASDRLDVLTQTLSQGPYSQGDGGELSQAPPIKLNMSAPDDWSFYCKKDNFNGSKSCTMSSGSLMVALINGGQHVYVGRNHYPRSQSAIKVDGNQTIRGDEGVSQSPQKVINQLRSGKVAYTRYVEWPYNYNADGEVDLSNFNQKYNDMLEKYRNL